jgi:hypothetical protein
MRRRTWRCTSGKSSIRLASGIPVNGSSQVELAGAGCRTAS